MTHRRITASAILSVLIECIPFSFKLKENVFGYIFAACQCTRTYSMEKGDFAIGIFIDFRKAFDTVDHSILLHKLYHYGVRGPAYDWFCDYLNNRTQLVSFNNV